MSYSVLSTFRVSVDGPWLYMIVYQFRPTQRMVFYVTRITTTPSVTNKLLMSLLMPRTGMEQNYYILAFLLAFFLFCFFAFLLAFFLFSHFLACFFAYFRLLSSLLAFLLVFFFYLLACALFAWQLSWLSFLLAFSLTCFFRCVHLLAFSLACFFVCFRAASELAQSYLLADS